MLPKCMKVSSQRSHTGYEGKAFPITGSTRTSTLLHSTRCTSCHLQKIMTASFNCLSGLVWAGMGSVDDVRLQMCSDVFVGFNFHINVYTSLEHIHEFNPHGINLNLQRNIQIS